MAKKFPVNLASPEKRDELLHAAINFMNADKPEKGEKNYNISAKRLNAISKEKDSFLPSHTKVCRCVGLQEEDFCKGTIDNTIRRLQEAAEAKQNLHHQLIAGKHYSDVLRFSNMIDLFMELAAHPEKLLFFNDAFLEYWKNKELRLETSYTDDGENYFRGFVTFPSWTAILLAPVLGEDLTFEFSFSADFDPQTDQDDPSRVAGLEDEFCVAFTDEICSVLYDLSKEKDLNPLLKELAKNLEERIVHIENTDFGYFEYFETRPMTEEEFLDAAAELLAQRLAALRAKGKSLDEIMKLFAEGKSMDEIEEILG